MRTFHGLLILMTILVTACAGGSTGSSASPATATALASVAPSSTVASASPSTAAPAASVTGVVDLPASCVESIRAYVIAIEPIVKDVQWQAMTGMPPQVEAQLGNVTTPFDPEACPDLSVTEAHDAWTAIAFDAAPGTLDYIDFVYRP